jgi:hypothetical protein
MGLALRNLPEAWQEKHGYRPLLAETFTDIESFEGTCYKASNWEPCGLTKGFERKHRAWLNFPPKLKGRPGRRAPSYQALYNLLGKLDPNDLSDTLNAWLAAHHGTLPRALALDGKYIRDLLLTLALSEHESGAPVAITIASKEPKSEASKTEGEITAAKRLYQQVDLRNAVVTGDALHCERENMQLVIENDGDFLFQLKGNQPTALTEAERIAAIGSPLLPAKQKIAGTVG